MTDTICNKLTAVVSPIVTLYFGEAETDRYPYAVYSMVTEERRSKDGVYRIAASTTLDIVAKDYDIAKGIYLDVREAMDDMTEEGQYVAVHKETSRSCVEGIWTITIQYTIIQNS